MKVWKIGLIGTFLSTFGLILLGFTKIRTGCFSSGEIIGGLFLLIASVIFSIFAQIDR